MRKCFLLVLALCFFAAPALVFAQNAETEEIVKLTSIELADAYTKDKDAAEEKYTNKIVEITGKVTESYTMNMPDMPHVSLEGNEMGDVLCYFDSQEDLLEKGSEVVIRGKCKGALFDSPSLDASEIIKR